ncbi:anthranilate synthase component II [Microbacterium commune]|uniref:anthranilate synthase component II n=1 Tax=Microbacterium commune TaxID=2762219 RepID=UPI00296FDE32|nr:aminodeoxychorismate/anthranilate synthase component II [Microbacterium commune]
MTARVLVVDNHDSFVHTLIGYLRELGAEVVMVEADAAGPAPDAEVRHHWRELLLGFDAVMISPGPGSPADAGASIEVVRLAAEIGMPLLGVCLGHQTIGEAFGGAVGAAPELMHGMVSQVSHDASSLFDGIPSPFAAGRYHSLALDDASLPPMLRVSARAEHGTIMAVEHDALPIIGVQFHPESVLTEHGHRLLGNWLASVRADGVGCQPVGGTQ